MKGIAALILALCLSVPALAAEALPPRDRSMADLFPAGYECPGYTDVTEADWFHTAAAVCCEVGLMRGMEGEFRPWQALTVGEIAAIAAPMNEALTGIPIPPPVPNPGLPWYQHHMDYLEELGISLPDGEAPATRLEFVTLLAAVLPEECLSPINDIPPPPDTEAPAVLAFYRAGILAGRDSRGAFAGEEVLTRAEGAAILARIVRPELRLVAGF
ncbi:hypothetical protein D1159_04375 [Pseudoflavonifractor sp. 524-17]|uniref:S-layer homology domain-containing protein n=1 Tax=Pseudoflavonifractor sp. 524-17 TaxID=2304577 RepID=UPI001379756F|nr:S-layer homology domain-containing protein [Pseudoflavonifractor sp. 524-17]NCE63835.1 hypothetical protein [Pseudoflavonifractor sp. 524-17]